MTTSTHRPTESGTRRPATPTAAAKSGPLLALAAACVSGVAVYLNGRAVRQFPSPTVYTTAKNLLAGALVLAVAIAVTRRRAGPTVDPTRTARTGRSPSTWITLAVIAVIGGAVPFVLFFEGLARATSTDAAFIHKTLVVWAAVLAVVVLRERITNVHILAVVCLVVGHALLAGGIGQLRPGRGEAMILAATLCWSIEVILVKRLTAVVPSTDIAAARLAGGSVLLVGWVALQGDLATLVGLTGAQWAWIGVTAPVLATFVTLWFAALERASVLDVTSILVLGAVITGLLRIVIDGAALGPLLPGQVLIVIGVGAVLVHALRRHESMRHQPRWS